MKEPEEECITSDETFGVLGRSFSWEELLYSNDSSQNVPGGEDFFIFEEIEKGKRR